MTALYLAGPMRSIEGLNRPAFHDAAKRLRDVGFKVFSPAEQDQEFIDKYGDEPDIRHALNEDLDWLTMSAEGVALLPGWSASLGASAEVAVAHAIGIPVHYWIDWVEQAKEKSA